MTLVVDSGAARGWNLSCLGVANTRSELLSPSSDASNDKGIEAEGDEENAYDDGVEWG